MRQGIPPGMSNVPIMSIKIIKFIFSLFYIKINNKLTYTK